MHLFGLTPSYGCRQRRQIKKCAKTSFSVEALRLIKKTINNHCSQALWPSENPSNPEMKHGIASNYKAAQKEKEQRNEY